MANFTVFCSNLLLAVLILCTLQGDVICTFGGVQVTFKHSGYTVTESAGKVAITLQAARSGLDYFAAFYVKIKASVNKNLNPSASSNDFEESIQIVRFQPKQSTATVYIKIKDDKIVERTEAFQVAILIPYYLYLKGIRFGSPSIAKVFIKDDDKVPVTKPPISSPEVIIQFETTSTFVNENDGTVTVNLLRKTGTLSNNITVCIDIAMSKDADISQSAINERKVTVDISPSDDDVIPVVLNLQDDNIVEPMEFYQLTIFNVSDPNVVVGVVNITFIIVNDDDVEPVTIEFETANITTNESDGSVTINLVRRTGTLSDNITVCINVTMIMDPAIIQSAINVTKVIVNISPSDDDVIPVVLNLQDDSIVEPTDIYQLTIVNVSDPNVVVGDMNTISITVNDDDEKTTVIIEFETASINVNESDRSVTANLVRRTGTLSDNITVCIDITTIMDPAIVQSAINVTKVIMDISPSDDDVIPVVLNLQDDSIVEPTDFYQLTIVNVSDPNVVVGDMNTSFIIVNDDDVILPVVTIEFNAATVIVNESDGSVTINLVRRTGTLSDNITVCIDIIMVMNSAIIQPSINETKVTVDISPSDDEVIPVVLNLQDDSIVEPTDLYQLTIVNVSDPNVIVGEKNTSFIIVNDDDDGFSVMFNSSSYSGVEADGSIAVTVIATGVSPFPYNVTITLSELDPISSGELPDYSNDTIVITFNPGDSEKTVLIAVNPDCEIKGSEFFNLTLSLGPSIVTPGIFLGDPSEAAAEIEDTEIIEVEFTEPLFFGNEATGMIETRIRASGFSQQPYDVIVTPVEADPPDALGSGIDYMSDSVVATFNPGDAEATVSIPLINDAVDEETEFFGLVLMLGNKANIEGRSCVTLGMENTGIIGTILDDDDKPATSPPTTSPTTPSITLPTIPPPTAKPSDEQMSVKVQFKFIRYTIQESCTMLSVALVVMGEAIEPFTVHIKPISFYLPHASAKASEEDFEAEVLQVTFLPGQSHSSVCVIITDDDIIEGNEYFHLLLSIPYSVRAQGVWVGYPYYADVQILDDDDDGIGLPVQLPPTDDDRAAMCRCKPRLTPPSSTPPPSPSPSPSLSLIPSPISSLLPLSSPISSFIPSPSPSPSPPPTIPPLLNFTVMFNDTIFSGSEADGVIAVVVVVTGESSLLYNVTITPSELVPVSARELFDYSNDTIVLTFNPGDTEQTVLIAVNSDYEREGSEFFNLTLSLDPTAEALGIILGDPSVAVAEIEDTDMIYVNFSQATYSAKEGDGMMMITVEADGFSIWPYTVEINPMEILPVGGSGNAEGNGTDFVSDTLVAMFNPGDSQAVVSMPVIMDQEFEPTEALQFSLTVSDEFSNINGRLLIIPGSNDMALGGIIDSNVIVNFSADSYRAVPNATSVFVGVIAFGFFDSEFVVQGILKAVHKPERGNVYFDSQIKKFRFLPGVKTAVVTIEAVGNRDLDFTATLVVPPAAMSQGVIVGEPSVANVTIPAKG